ncbi:hypothetical protein CPB86DRAFT_830523 [Serendipita vermifera]|nr:hypothetical protein CPB86DRAFT_830523 [Serendipita vermifera]
MKPRAARFVADSSRQKAIKRDALEGTVEYGSSTRRMSLIWTKAPGKQSSEVHFDHISITSRILTRDSDDHISLHPTTTGKEWAQGISDDSTRRNLNIIRPIRDPGIEPSVEISYPRHQANFALSLNQLKVSNELSESIIPQFENHKMVTSTSKISLEQDRPLSRHMEALPLSSAASFGPELLPSIHLLNQKVDKFHRYLDEVRARSLLKNWRAIPKEPRGESTIQNRGLLKLQTYIKEHAVYFLGIRDREAPEQWPSPTATSIQDINKAQWPVDRLVLGDIPNENLTLDWANPGLTNWTKHVTAAFVADFLSEYRGKSFPLKEDPNTGEIIRIFIRFVLHLKAIFVKHRDKLPISNRDEQARRKARKRSRRRQLLKLRKTIVSQYEIPGPSLKALHLLGADGMSSEDSEGERYTDYAKPPHIGHSVALSNLNDSLTSLDEAPRMPE